jgi:hypothetical protein
MREKFNPLIKSRGTRPDSYRDDPATETKSIGLSADALGRLRRHLIIVRLRSHSAGPLCGIALVAKTGSNLENLS